MKKKLPDFKSEDDERTFWAAADSTEYVDWRSAKPAKLIHLKPSPYQSLLKVFLAERLAQEHHATRVKRGR